MVCPAVLLQSFVWMSLMATGVQYDVTHIISSMCVVRQSTVYIPCKYDHPQHEQGIAVQWFHQKSPVEVRVSQDPAFKGRVEFQADAGNCSLLLRDVRKRDAGNFRVVLSTASGRNWTNAQGIRLEVTDAEVEVKTESDIVTEGDWICFICGSCIPSMTVPTYIWRKDGHLYSQRYGDNALDLESVGLEDSGQYFCTLSGHEGLNSISVDITVRPGYPPKSVSVSVSASEIVEADSVTLSCNSDAKPLAEISWIKGEMTVGSGGVYIISDLSSDDSGEYKCRSRNKYGEKDSDAVKMNVMYAPRDVVVTLNSSGVIVEGDSVTLSCSSDSNPPALNFSWFKEDQTSAVGSGQSFSISSFSSSSSGRFYCEAQNKYGSQRSASVSLSVEAEESVWSSVIVGISAAAVMTVILMLVVWLLIRRKRATPSEEQNPRGSRRHKTVESPEDAYMTLEPRSRCAEYDTLDNMKRSCDTDGPEDQDSTYNMDN